MAGNLINTKMLRIIKPFKVGDIGIRHCMSQLARRNGNRENTRKISETVAANEGRQPSCWMPDPRTGIYFPTGQERVMDDVPKGAASFSCTFWMRNIEGVEVDKEQADDAMHHSSN